MELLCQTMDNTDYVNMAKLSTLILFIVVDNITGTHSYTGIGWTLKLVFPCRTAQKEKSW